MSVLALQRVIVRMLYDESFTRAVYDDVAAATATDDLSDDERAWLVAADPRAYGVDPLRRSRSLKGLLEEYPVGCAHLVRSLGRDHAVARLDAYFSSSAFHACIRDGGSLAESFGSWLLSSEAGDADVARREAVTLELAVVRARRAAPRRDRRHDVTTPEARALDGTLLAFAPGVSVHELREGSVDAYGAALGALRHHPRGLVEGVLDVAFTLPRPGATEALEGAIVHGSGADLRLESASVELVRVLAPCAHPIAFEEFVRRAAEQGAEREDCVGLVTSFAADGVLVVCTRD